MIGAFTGIGVWHSAPPAHRDGSGRGILLDRDGVLVVERNYLHRSADVALMPSVLRLVLAAQKQNIPVAVVTNQSGIDRGRFGWDDFFAVEAEIDRQLAAHGARIDFKVACPFHPEFTPGYGPEMDVWRKPGPAMVTFACAQLGLDPSQSWLIGDKAGDIRAACAGHLSGAYFLRGVYRDEEPAALACAGEGFWVRSLDSDDAIPL